MCEPEVKIELPGFSVDEIRMAGSGMIVVAHATALSGVCPQCQQTARRVHSRYHRSARDLLISGQPVRLRLRVRRFFCDNAECGQQTFCERLPTLVSPQAQRTMRFTQALEMLAFALGGERAASLARQLALPSSPDTSDAEGAGRS